MDQFSVRIPRTNILRPKEKAPFIDYKQTKIKAYCKVLGERQNILRPKKNQVVKSKRQTRLKTFAVKK
ncbi:hypothetical protein ACHAWO_001082 [Cyclotella atomus]|uniref:Ribosomal protein S18 n=1 Tax=Cyclotella atomus TaxID=382360 RepID=A0ABD3PIT4_9STRA